MTLKINDLLKCLIGEGEAKWEILSESDKLLNYKRFDFKHFQFEIHQLKSLVQQCFSCENTNIWHCRICRQLLYTGLHLAMAKIFNNSINLYATMKRMRYKLEMRAKCVRRNVCVCIGFSCEN